MLFFFFFKRPKKREENQCTHARTFTLSLSIFVSQHTRKRTNGKKILSKNEKFVSIWFCVSFRFIFFFSFHFCFLRSSSLHSTFLCFLFSFGSYFISENNIRNTSCRRTFLLKRFSSRTSTHSFRFNSNNNHSSTSLRYIRAEYILDSKSRIVSLSFVRLLIFLFHAVCFRLLFY